MKSKKIKAVFKPVKIKKTFTGKHITKYSGLQPIMEYMMKIGIVRIFDSMNERIHNSTKHTKTQLFMPVVMSSPVNINRMSRIEEFTKDILVRKLPGPEDRADAGTICGRIKQSGATELQEKLSGMTNRRVRETLGLKR